MQPKNVLLRKCKCGEKSSDISILNVWHIAQDFGISARILTYQVRLAYQLWNGEVANALLHDLFLMCHAAQNQKSDLEALSCWLDCVFIQIRGVQELDDCDCDAAYGRAIQCECAERVNKPNEKDNASARLTLLQVLGLICPTAGRIMSNSDILQKLLATKDEDPNGLNCDCLSTAFARVQMDGSLGMGFVDRDHVALVNVDCMTVRANGRRCAMNLKMMVFGQTTICFILQLTSWE